MRHRILTCKNHPELRWSCKDIAWGSGGFNGARSLQFRGIPTGEGLFSDGSGIHTTMIRPQTNLIITECSCSVGDLVLAPEDALVKP